MCHELKRSLQIRVFFRLLCLPLFSSRTAKHHQHGKFVRVDGLAVSRGDEQLLTSLHAAAAGTGAERQNFNCNLEKLRRDRVNVIP